MVALTGIEPDSRCPIWPDVVVTGWFHVDAGRPVPYDCPHRGLRCDQCV